MIGPVDTALILLIQTVVLPPMTNEEIRKDLYACDAETVQIVKNFKGETLKVICNDE